MGNSQPLFLFLLFLTTNFTDKAVGFRGIQTLIVREEGEHADHLTTTTVREFSVLALRN